jgi:hypothetical protein
VYNTDVESNTAYRKNADRIVDPWVRLSIGVATQGEQDSAESVGVMPLGKVVHPLAGYLALVMVKQCNLRKRGVRGQGTERILKKGSRLLKERAGNFMYEKGNAES